MPRFEQTLELSHFAGASDKAGVLAAGFDRHIAKPIHPDELIATISQLIPSAARTG